MGQIAKRVEDKLLLKLIRAFLNAGVMENGLISPSVEGTPQGGPFTPRTQKITSNLSRRSGWSGGWGTANDTPSDLDLCHLQLYM
jgi:retron-type reverse transcriptase